MYLFILSKNQGGNLSRNLPKVLITEIPNHIIIIQGVLRLMFGVLSIPIVTNISHYIHKQNHYLAHLKLIKGCESIISQLNQKETRVPSLSLSLPELKETNLLFKLATTTKLMPCVLLPYPSGTWHMNSIKIFYIPQVFLPVYLCYQSPKGKVPFSNSTVSKYSLKALLMCFTFY